ncbi:MAG: class I SAM-dependent methyltransferase [Chloroflexaceae bacterium]|jgi:ubiquinone/menaquinone biosynthesis C-methylase UbiE|nr:class I SAM-dependent methyltransferase [Chloroflexaceae bacterium]
MVPRKLFSILQCPTCGSQQLYVHQGGVDCACCRSSYPIHQGYIDLMPRGAQFDYTSKYVSEEEELAEELDYRELAPALLAAGVRDRTLARLLDFQPTDVALDNGCGTAKHAVWNAHRVGLMVGSDPATLFADEALRQVALAKADSRVLPFADNTIDKSFSIDILEHFPRDVIDAYLRETARVLRPGGRMLIFSNTREMSPIQPIINLSRRLGRLFVKAGVYDFQREARRKSDHLKALESWDDVLDAMHGAGLRPVRVIFWNSLFTTFVEHVLMKLGEAVLGRNKPDQRREAATGQGTQRRRDAETQGKENAQHSALSTQHSVQSKIQNPNSQLSTLNSQLSTPNSDGTAREIRARQRMRGRLQTRGLVYYALLAITLLMELDLRLFGWMRCGSYFLLVEKPDKMTR